jgi:hypothetical protein
VEPTPGEAQADYTPDGPEEYGRKVIHHESLKRAFVPVRIGSAFRSFQAKSLHFLTGSS